MDTITCCRHREGEESKKAKQKMMQERLRIEGKMKKQRQRAQNGENEQPLNVD